MGSRCYFARVLHPVLERGAGRPVAGRSQDALTRCLDGSSGGRCWSSTLAHSLSHSGLAELAAAGRGRPWDHRSGHHDGRPPSTRWFRGRGVRRGRHQLAPLRARSRSRLVRHVRSWSCPSPTRRRAVARQPVRPDAASIARASPVGTTRRWLDPHTGPLHHHAGHRAALPIDQTIVSATIFGGRRADTPSIGRPDWSR